MWVTSLVAYHAVSLDSGEAGGPTLRRETRVDAPPVTDSSLHAMDPMTGTILVMAVGIVVVAVLTFLLFLFWKSRPFADGHVFVASRLSRGNRLFPTQVLISPQSVVHYTPQWIGRHEHSIHMAHVASVRIDTHLFFSDVFIETTGGQNAIQCRGHRKGEAVEMKELIERFQSEYYRAGRPAAAVTPPPVA